MINVVDTATHADMLSVRPALPVTLVTLLMLILKGAKAELSV